MNTENPLKKSVVASKSSPLQRIFPLVVGFLIVSLFGNLMQCAFSRSTTFARDRYQEAMFQNWKTIDQLEKENASLRYDLKELTSDEAEVLQVTDERSGNDVWECLDHPQGLLLSPWALGLNYWEFKVHNPEPILSTSMYGDYWFVPGSACSIDVGGAISVTRMDGLYVLQPWTPPTTIRSYAACPDSAYHLVSSNNQFVWHAVYRACLTKIKARDLGLSVLSILYR